MEVQPVMVRKRMEEINAAQAALEEQSQQQTEQNHQVEQNQQQMEHSVQ